MKLDCKLAGVILVAFSTSTLADNWQPVTDSAELKKLFSNKEFSATLKGDVKATATYNQDGTGILNAWGDSFTRKWSVKDQSICIEAASDSHCVKVEKNQDKPNMLRGTRTDTGEKVEFSFQDSKAVLSTKNATSKGGAGTPSAEELALKLSNPTAPVMTIGNNVDYIMFDGDREGASDQSAIRYSFQTVFPFKLADGKGTVFFRPTIPAFFNEPIYQGSGNYDDSGFTVGDIGFDLSYGQTTKSGMIYGGGIVGTIPTGTDLSADLFGLGPELLVGKIGKWGATLGLLTHQWDVAGSGDGDINSTSLTYIYAFQLGGGWQLAAAPVITYDHNADSDNALALPLGIGISKTAVIAGRPWKFQAQYWNYVEQNEEFGAEHQFRFSFSPVVSAPWNEGK